MDLSRDIQLIRFYFTLSLKLQAFFTPLIPQRTTHNNRNTQQGNAECPDPLLNNIIGFFSIVFLQGQVISLIFLHLIPNQSKLIGRGQTRLLNTIIQVIINFKIILRRITGTQFDQFL
ncbi:hypothetical protein D3C86_1748460 [compost metagenome]